jgi:hypothetical protein
MKKNTMSIRVRSIKEIIHNGLRLNINNEPGSEQVELVDQNGTILFGVNNIDQFDRYYTLTKNTKQDVVPMWEDEFGFFWFWAKKGNKVNKKDKDFLKYIEFLD